MDDSAAVSRLDKFVRAGGGLLVLAGKRTADSSSLTASGLLAGDVGHSVQKRARVTALSPHPALLGLRAEQISHAPVWERVDLQPGADDFVLARFDDGSAALTERRVDAGISLTLATTLERSSSALALEPGFDPAVASELAARGHDLVMDEAEHLFGGAQLIVKLEDGYCGGSDHRKEGLATGF